MNLRTYQVDACDAILQKWNEGDQRTLLVLPTGTGKTIVFSNVIAEQVKKGDRCLILAHRGELLEQAADKLYKATGIHSAVEKADETATNSLYRVTVGSVQTLMRQSRLDKFPKNYYHTIVIDEAHHAISSSYRNVLNHFDSAKVLGVTATPDRGDMRGLSEIFQSIAYEYPLQEAIRDGHLCNIKAQTIPLKLDISSVGVQAGDFRGADIDSALDPYLEQIAEAIKTYASARKTVVFLPLIATSQKFCTILKEKGIAAAEVNGNSTDRAEILQDFEQGKYQVLCNSMLLTEGWDCPSVDCVVVLRPTKVRSLYAQMIGRGTRLHPGKSELLILDFLWHTEKHELCRPACLIGASQDCEKQMIKKSEESGEAQDLLELEKEANDDVVAQREQALAERLSKMRHKKSRLVDVMQFELSINSEKLINYQEVFAWEMAPPTEKQIKAIEAFGLDSSEATSKGKAKVLLDCLIKRKESGLTSPKQIRFLECRGFQHVGTWDSNEANKLIKRIVANHWRVPYEIHPATYKPRKEVEEW